MKRTIGIIILACLYFIIMGALVGANLNTETFGFITIVLSITATWGAILLIM